MAMIKLAHGLHDINGKRGGNIYRYDQCGHHAQGYPRLVNKPPSYLQKKQREYFIKCQKIWAQIAYTAIMWNWHLWSALHPITNKKGESKIRTARQMFFSFNMIRLGNDLSIIVEPPWETL